MFDVSVAAVLQIVIAVSHARKQFKVENVKFKTLFECVDTVHDVLQEIQSSQERNAKQNPASQSSPVPFRTLENLQICLTDIERFLAKRSVKSRRDPSKLVFPLKFAFGSHKQLMAEAWLERLKFALENLATVFDIREKLNLNILGDPELYGGSSKENRTPTATNGESLPQTPSQQGGPSHFFPGLYPPAPMSPGMLASSPASSIWGGGGLYPSAPHQPQPQPQPPFSPSSLFSSPLQMQSVGAAPPSPLSLPFGLSSPSVARARQSQSVHLRDERALLPLMACYPSLRDSQLISTSLSSHSWEDRVRQSQEMELVAVPGLAGDNLVDSAAFLCIGGESQILERIDKCIQLKISHKNAKQSLGKAEQIYFGMHDKSIFTTETKLKAAEAVQQWKLKIHALSCRLYDNTLLLTDLLRQYRLLPKVCAGMSIPTPVPGSLLDWESISLQTLKSLAVQQLDAAKSSLARLQRDSAERVKELCGVANAQAMEKLERLLPPLDDSDEEDEGGV